MVDGLIFLKHPPHGESVRCGKGQQLSESKQQLWAETRNPGDIDAPDQDSDFLVPRDLKYG